MASPQMRMPSEMPAQAGKRRRPALRLLGAERSEEIFPVLLEEIVALGYPACSHRAGELRNLRNLAHCFPQLFRAFLQRFQTSLYAVENPLVRILHASLSWFAGNQA